MNTLILICGLPGAGKTTLAKKLAAELPAVRFCPDEWMEDLGVTLWDEQFRDRLEDRFWKLGKELLRLGQTVILEYGFWMKAQRDEKLNEARAFGFGVELHYLELPDEELRRRLAARGMEGDDIILESKLAEWTQTIERPSDDELRLYDNYQA